jgi:DNA polymerase-3 subunit delta'
MGFEALLGNERLRQNISRSIQRGHISHFYLISGPKGSGKHTLARLLAAAIHCSGTSGKPCLQCTACRKVLSGNHPDYITIDDPEKKTVPVDLIREARADIYVRPNEAQHKIYLFPRAQDMGIPGQNALLKVLEEPPAYGVFILLTDNPDKLLPTVRSRCTELTLTALPQPLLRQSLREHFPQAAPEDLDAAIARSGGYLGQAKELLASGEFRCEHTETFAQCYAARDVLGLVRLLVPMERWKRDQLVPVLARWEETLQSALVSRSGIPAISAAARQLSTARSSQELMEAIGHIQKAIVYTQSNVSVAAVCGYLQWVLR